MIVVWKNIHRDILICNSPTLKSRAAIGVWYVGAIKLWFLGATRLWESSLFVGSCFFSFWKGFLQSGWCQRYTTVSNHIVSNFWNDPRKSGWEFNHRFLFVLPGRVYMLILMDYPPALPIHQGSNRRTFWPSDPENSSNICGATIFSDP